ncbi:MAG TPA: LPS biosynthesis protein WbpP [Verrucomicrobia bacterium]|nr:MAG: Vi polysaccharide biosynthesis protein VipB/TviC [Lentisphaerae bacterium GWF2_57_35]HBA85846.1 LPS biosynthesis protein WbpP [Verrucomicrobiota bacterium]
MGSEYLVTGGAGFIGSNIVGRLVEDRKTVRVLDNFSTGSRDNLKMYNGNLDVLEGDLRDVRAVADAVKGVRCVVHLGALPSVSRSINDPQSTHDVNFSGTLNLLLQAREAGVERLVFSSSSSVYGDTLVLPKREDMLPVPKSPYALSKLAGEHYCRLFYELYGLKTYALRYFNVFGPRQSPQSQYAAVIPLFVDALRKGEKLTIYGDGEQTRDFTYIDDVVSANLACCEAPESAAGDVYNVAHGFRISVNQLADRLEALVGVRPGRDYVPARAGDVRDSQADSSKAREKLKWEPKCPFEDGLKRTVDWFMRG